MTHRKKRSQKFSTFFIRLIILVSFVIIALLVVGYAQGIKFNQSTMTLVTTGAINLSGNVKDAHILLNGREVGTALPQYIKDLSPNSKIEIVINKDGYHAWVRSFNIRESIVQSVNNITIFKLSYVPISVDAQNATNICLKNSPSNKDLLLIEKGEIRYLGNLITRISSNVSYACWFRDQTHIAYATNKQIRVVEKDGTNDTLIYESEIPIKTVVSAEDNAAIFYSDQTDKWWKIEL